jgi:hypothetical protein
LHWERYVSCDVVGCALVVGLRFTRTSRNVAGRHGSLGAVRRPMVVGRVGWGGGAGVVSVGGWVGEGFGGHCRQHAHS